MALEQAKRADVDSMLLLRGEAQTYLSFLIALGQPRVRRQHLLWALSSSFCEAFRALTCVLPWLCGVYKECRFRISPIQVGWLPSIND